MRARIVIIGVLWATGLALAACGGPASSTSSSSSSTTTAGSAKAAFVRQANQICKQVNVQTDSLKIPGDPSKVTPDQLPAWGQYTEQVLGFGQKAESDLKALTVPPGDEAAVNGLLAAFNTEVQDFQTTTQAAVQNDLSGFQSAFQKLQSDSNALHSTAKAYGLGPECAP